MLRPVEAVEVSEDVVNFWSGGGLNLLAGTSTTTSKLRFRFARDAGIIPKGVLGRTTGGGGGEGRGGRSDGGVPSWGRGGGVGSGEGCVSTFVTADRGT